MTLTHPPPGTIQSIVHTEDARLIEDSLPLAEISAQSAREKSIRHGHISTLHIWWARRPLVACRGAIYAALTPAPQTEAERKAVHARLVELCTWEASNNQTVLDKARRDIRAANGGVAPRVLDMFAGGGAIPLEALRLGCEAHALDLNPVAHLIELCTLVYPQQYGGETTDDGRRTIGPGPTRDGRRPAQPSLLPDDPSSSIVHRPSSANRLATDVRRWGQWMLAEARKEIGDLYPSVDRRTPAAYLWARTVICPNPTCRATVPLARQTWLVRKADRQLAMEIVPVPGEKRVRFKKVNISGEAGATPETDESMSAADATGGSMARASSACPICGTTVSSVHIKAEGMAGRIGHQLIAVVTVGTKQGKEYSEATPAEQARLDEASKQLQRFVDEHGFDGYTVPDEPIPTGNSRAIFVWLYGMLKWGDLFNPRQALALLTFARLVRQAHDQILAETGDAGYAKAVTTLLACAVDRLVDKNSVLALWNNIGEKIEHTFGRQALPMVWDYAEVPPFSGATGDWRSGVEWVAKAVEHCGAAANGSAAVVQLGSATALPYPDSHFDAVITDPPYYDSVPYADLSDFFYVWLKRSVGFLYPAVFATPLTPKRAEIIQEPARHGGKNNLAKAFFEQQMGLSFREAARVLKPDGVAVIVYAHKDSAAWETLLNALLDADLIVTSSWPINTERPGRLRAQGSAALASSFFLACRKRSAEAAVGDYRTVVQALEARVNERMELFWQQGIRGADLFISAIGPAVEVFGQHRRVERGSGATVGVADLLRIVRRLVVSYALRQVFHGGAAEAVDPATLFYVFYRYWYKGAKMPFGEILPLLVAMGLDSDRLMARDGILKKEGSNVRLRSAGERASPDDLGTPTALGPAPLVDVLHRALVLQAQGGSAGAGAAAEYLGTLEPERRAALWQVAQSLLDVLPDNDAEKKALAVLLSGKDRAERAAGEAAARPQATQERLFE